MDFNPYIYARNNPYRYIDRNGEFGVLVALGLSALIGGGINVAANWDNINNAGDFFMFFSVGATAGVVGAAAAVMAPAGFIAGALYGAVGSGLSGAILGGGNAAILGQDIGSAMFTGAWQGALTGFVFGGIYGGAKANANGLKYWSGKSKTPSVSANPAANTSATPQNAGPKYLKPGEEVPKGDWPPSDRIPGTTTIETLEPGTRVDRYCNSIPGHTKATINRLKDGMYTSEPGVSVDMRAIPYDPKTAPYAQWELIKSVDVERSIAAPFPKYGLPGGGVQYRFIHPVTGGFMSPKYMETNGYIKLIKIRF